MKKLGLLVFFLANLLLAACGPEHSDSELNGNDSERLVRVSLSKKLLTLYHSGTAVKTYMVAVGAPNSKSPVGQFKIVNRQNNPGGAYGAYWLGLSADGYGIHGTNNPASIGKAVSHGCIRMRNSDVLDFQTRVDRGDPVHILN